MKSFTTILVLLLLRGTTFAQFDSTWGYISKRKADSLRASIENEQSDTLRMAAIRSLGFYYQEIQPDSSLYFHQQQLTLAKKLNLKLWQADAYSQIGYIEQRQGNPTKSFESFSKAQEIASDEKNETSNWHVWTFSNAQNFHDSRMAILGVNYQMMGNLYGDLGEVEKQKYFYDQTLKIGDSIHNGKIITLAYLNMASLYSADSALTYYTKALQYGNASGYKEWDGYSQYYIGLIFYKKNEPDSLKKYALQSMQANRRQDNLRSLVYSYYALSLYYRIRNINDSSIYFAKEALTTAISTGSATEILTGYEAMSDAYKSANNIDSAYKYKLSSGSLNDSLQAAKLVKLTEYQNFSFNEQLRLKKQEDARIAYENNIKMYTLLAGLAAILLIALILYRNNRHKQRANKKLEKALSDLKSAQSQLIQSEKMASLGELTAGIAHEIQNPLNFVNNFSEVNNELIEEMTNENDMNEIKSVALDVKQNNEKIVFHGKRVGAIVRSMLQHSGVSSGKKEPTDINNLCKEYVRLAYHGLRVKEKMANAEIKTDFDTTVGRINIVPQDIGRVILNLLNNAFYAVNEKQKACQAGPVEAGYNPEVTVSTKKTDNSVRIAVSDNGIGIPDSIKEKIFQPFFTTKPTGSGTGLGLSLSYDIVKAHGGEIKVESKKNERTEFIIQLPV